MNFHEFDDTVELHGASVPEWLEAADLATSHPPADDQAPAFVAGGEVQFGACTGPHAGRGFHECAQRADINDPDDEAGAEHGVFVPARGFGCEAWHSASFEAEAVDERAPDG